MITTSTFESSPPMETVKKGDVWSPITTDETDTTSSGTSVKSWSIEDNIRQSVANLVTHHLKSYAPEE